MTWYEEAVRASRRGVVCTFRDNMSNMRREAVGLDGRVYYSVAAEVLLGKSPNAERELGAFGSAPWGALDRPDSFPSYPPTDGSLPG